MTSESLGMGINVRIKERSRITGTTLKVITGHNIITRTGLQVLADFISAHFSSGQILDLSNEEINENPRDLINLLKALVSNLPYCVHLGTTGYDTTDPNLQGKESYYDTDVLSPIVDPVTGKKIALKISGGSSTMQSALVSSLQALSVNGYEHGITISYSVLSDSNVFENFPTGANGVIVDGEGHTIELKELSLMNKDETKCWARIAFDQSHSLVLNKNRVYDVLWNINLVSIPTQLKELNG